MVCAATAADFFGLFQHLLENQGKPQKTLIRIVGHGTLSSLTCSDFSVIAELDHLYSCKLSFIESNFVYIGLGSTIGDGQTDTHTLLFSKTHF